MPERKVCWRITRYCNLHCSHCLAGHANAIRRDLSSEERLTVMTAVITSGVTRITWTGGEPTLCEDLPMLLRLSHLAKVRTVMTTHGLALRPAFLAALDPQLDRIRISFDGLRETHNRIRGGPVFDRALQALRLPHTSGFITEANVTVLAENVREIPELLTRLAANGASRIVLLTLMQRESAIDNGILAPSAHEAADLFARLAHTTSVSIQLNNYSDGDDGYIVIESDGEVLLCTDSRGDISYGFMTETTASDSLRLALAHQTLTHRTEVATQAVTR